MEHVGLIHLVRQGEELRLASGGIGDDFGLGGGADDIGLGGGFRRARFSNTLSRWSLSRVRRLIRVAEGLDGPVPTAAIVERAEAGADQKGALGALRMLDVEGVIHATAGRGRQLIWNPGPRPEGVTAPKMSLLRSPEIVLELLRFASASWFSTDFVVRECGFDPNLLDEPSDPEQPLEPAWQRGLPVNMFDDVTRHGRRYALGALKVLYWREKIAWRNYSTQAIEWRWLAQDGCGRTIRDWPGVEVPGGRVLDPYIDGAAHEAASRRLEARRDGAFLRERAYEDTYQKWIDTHHPAAAAAYRRRL